MDDEGHSSDARRLRGRLTTGVTVWTAGTGPAAAGLTVGSVLVADGEPPHLLGLLGDLADVLDRIRETERFVVHVLAEHQRPVAERFAGQIPVPGGPFRGLDVEASAHGPVLTELGTRVTCRLAEVTRRGYGMLVDGEIDDVRLGDLDAPLLHFRGAYRKLGPTGRVWEPPAPDRALPYE